MTFDDFLEKLRSHGSSVTGSGTMYKANCPAHEDQKPSLSLWSSSGGHPFFYKCHVGCTKEEIRAALSLPNGHRPGVGKAATAEVDWVASYEYTDERGAVLFVKERGTPKAFRIYRPLTGGKRQYKSVFTGGAASRKVLYRLPAVLEAVRDGHAVYVVEGEKDVHSVEKAGGVGTCNYEGAANAGQRAKWRPEYGDTLSGAHVVIVADKDVPGRAHAETIVADLTGKAASVKVVEAKEGKDFTDHFQAGYGLADLVEVVAPETDGSALLDDVEAFHRRFNALPSEAAYVAVTLWDAHTHLLDCFESTPRIAFLSPEPGSGKTRALEICETLVPHPMAAVNCTPAALFRAVSDLDGGRPTVLFDEIDTVFGPKAKDNEELRGLLNAGHRRSGKAYRCVGDGANQKVQAFPSYAAVAMAGLGDLPDTILTRSIVIRMRRRAPGERGEAYRARTHEPEGHQLRDRLAHWVGVVRNKVDGAFPDMPEGITDRPADVWEPLLAVADAAGGEWPERARAACVELVRASQAGDRGSLGIKLLADLREIFAGADRMSTAQIIEKLTSLDDSPWADLRGKPLDARGLARRLREYTTAENKPIKARNIKTAAGVHKGYHAEDLHDAWSRYLPAVGPKSATSATDAAASTPTSGNKIAHEGGEDLFASATTAGVSATTASAATSNCAPTSGVPKVAEVADLSVGKRSGLLGPEGYCSSCGSPRTSHDLGCRTKG